MKPKVTSADVLEALHHAAGLPIVADFYTHLYGAETVSTEKQGAFQALSQLSDAMRVRWRKEHGSGGAWRNGIWRAAEACGRTCVHWPCSAPRSGRRR